MKTSRKRAVYDTRFFIEYFYSSEEEVLERAKREFIAIRRRYVPTVVLHELYRINLEREGKEVADLRHSVIVKDFKVVAMSEAIAKESAMLRNKYRIPMADSVIAATGKTLRAPVVSDDEHLIRIKEIETRWIG